MLYGLHLLNAGAWLANAILWAFYVHVWQFGFVSLAAAVVAVILARSERYSYQWR